MGTKGAGFKGSSISPNLRTSRHCQLLEEGVLSSKFPTQTKTGINSAWAWTPWTEAWSPQIAILASICIACCGATICACAVKNNGQKVDFAEIDAGSRPETGIQLGVALCLDAPVLALFMLNVYLVPLHNGTNEW